MRFIAALLVFCMVVSIAAVQCRADIVILKNGKRYKGELNQRTLIILNPLKLKTIEILLEAGGTREEKLVSFEASDIATIIVEVKGAREVINLEELRRTSFEKQVTDSPPPESPPTGTPEHSPPDNQDTNRGRKGDLVLVGGGLVALSAGVLGGIGEDSGFDAMNYLLISAGAAAICYGVYLLLQSPSARSVTSEPDEPVEPGRLSIRLGVQTYASVSLSIVARF